MEELRVKELLAERGLTQKELAKKMGVAEISLSRSLRNNPSMETLKKIAEALEVKLSDLFEKKDSDIIGFLRVHGYLKQVTSLEDLKQLVEDIEIGKI